MCTARAHDYMSLGISFGPDQAHGLIFDPADLDSSDMAS